MKAPFDLQAVACKVYSILIELPECRDDDNKLLLAIWAKESESLTTIDFFRDLLDGKVSHFESIRRMRQKLQEKHSSLRGEKWDVRHQMEGAMCDQLTFFDTW
jgi:hypothetical protein